MKEGGLARASTFDAATALANGYFVSGVYRLCFVDGRLAARHELSDDR
ncbi:hypothetical protein ACVV2G_29710 [Streptomyces ziwulingensis]